MLSTKRHRKKNSTIVPERPVYTPKMKGKNNVKVLLTKASRVVVTLVCTGAFVYYLSIFFQMYWQYPTVVDVNVQFPDEPDLPAITVCNHNVLQKSKLCEYNKALCPQIGRFNNETSILRQVLATMTMPQILNMTIKQTDLFYRCTVKSETKTRDTEVCDNSVWLYFQKRVCYVLNSEWTANNSQLQLEKNDTEFRFVLAFNVEDSLFPNNSAAEIFIHSSISLPDSRSSHFSARVGSTYYIGIQKTTVNLMEPPYQTQCTNYTKRHRKSDEDSKLKNLSKKICYQQCLAELANTICTPKCIPECLVFMRNYLTKFNVCTSATKEQEKCCSQIMDKQKHCREQCPLECNIQLYDIQVDDNEYNIFNSDNDSDAVSLSLQKKMSGYRFSEVKFNLQMIRHTVYTHNAKITPIEILGYVGGYLGIWLGVSIPLLYDYVLRFLVYAKSVFFPKNLHLRDIIHHSRAITAQSQVTLNESESDIPTAVG